MDLLGILAQLVLDASASWLRMFIALGISVALGFGIGVLAATSRNAERVLLPVVDVLQTIPILAFFPFAIFVFVVILPGYIGINAAVIFLIITSMIWNIIFGVYESVKTLPNEFLEVARLYHFDLWTKLRGIYMPASFPRMVEQSMLSWSIGLFYLVTSEIFSIGNLRYSVTYGIGSGLVGLAAQGIGNYLLGLAVFIVFVIGTRLLFFKPLEDYSTRYTRLHAKPGMRSYEKALMDIIGMGMKTRYAKRIGVVAKDIRVLRKGTTGTAIRTVPVAPKPSQDMGRIAYSAIGLVALAAAAYIIVTNPTLLGYEKLVIPALGASFIRVWGAFAVISAISVPVCVYFIFISKRSQHYLLLFQILASIPATVLLPLIAQSLHGNGELVAFAVFMLSGIWYMIFGMAASTRTIPQSVFEVKRLFGVKGIYAWRKVYLKALLPGFITGAITGIAAEWNASIVAEYFTTSGISASASGSAVISSVGTGIGKLLDTSILPGGLGLGLMIIALLNIVVMILLLNTFVWRKAYRNVAKAYG